MNDFIALLGCLGLLVGAASLLCWGWYKPKFNRYDWKDNWLVVRSVNKRKALW